jgi:beta-aspartyl-dipeptidase (metallo-type)
VFIAVSNVEKSLTNMQARAQKMLTAPLKPKAAKRARPFQPLQITAGDDDEFASLDMVLIKNAVIYSPELIEARNVVVAGGKIVGLLTDEAAAPFEALLKNMNGHIVDAKGDFVVPGIVDIHLHLCGGGGEMGFASQTEPAKLHDLFDAGLTTVVGVLGTDSITKGPHTLLSKVEALNAEGITAYMYTGSYRVPAPTITSSVMHDVAFISQVVGVGEVAVGDHRSSHSSIEQLTQLASEARIGGMLSEKAGCTYFHMGKGKGAMKILNDIIENSELPITQLLPTHMSRSKELFDAGVEWVKKGGYIDLTARDGGTYGFIADAVAANRDADPTFIDRLICTSDANGSLPAFNDDGSLKSYATADAKALLRYINAM